MGRPFALNGENSILRTVLAIQDPWKFIPVAGRGNWSLRADEKLGEKLGWIGESSNASGFHKIAYSYDF